MSLKRITTAGLPEITEPLTSTRPAPVRGWILLDPDVSHLRHVLARCAQYRVNHLQISHGIVHSAVDLLTETWRAERVNLVTRLARPQQIETWVWTHELDRIPDDFMTSGGRVDIRMPALWAFLEDRYTQIFAAADFDGLVLTFQETQASVYHDRSVVSDEPQPARVTRLIRFLHELCRRHGKKLLVRTFCYNREEMQWILDGVKDTAREVSVMVKCQPADWNPYYPNNRLIKHFGERGRGCVVELDLGEEYHGQNAFPYLCPEYLRYRLNHILNEQSALPGGVAWGCAARIERYGARALGAHNELNLRVFSAVLFNPECDEQAVLREGLVEQYEQWGEAVGGLLKPTFDLVNAVIYPVAGTWGYLMHCAVADFFYVHDSLVAWPHIDEWVEDENLNGLSAKVVQADPAVHAAAEERLRGAEQRLDDMLAAEADLAEIFPVELRVTLAPALRRLEAFVRVNVAHHRVVFALYRWRKSGDEGVRKTAVSLLAAFRKAVDEHGSILFSITTEGVFLNRPGTEMFLAQCDRALEIGVDAMLAEKDNIGDFPTRYGHATAARPG